MATTYRSLIWDLAMRATDGEFHLGGGTCWWVEDHLEDEGVHLDSPLKTEEATELAIKDIKRIFDRMLSHKRSEYAIHRKNGGSGRYAQALEQHIKDLEAIVAN